MRPILFNGEMVRAILDGRKTVTRWAIKPPALYAIVEDQDGNCVGSYYEDERGGYDYPTIDDAPYQPGDILYVRETWAEVSLFQPSTGEYSQHYPYKATYKPDPFLDVPSIQWRPSIHMPREAARIFLRVKDVRVERLQDITPKQIDAEGCKEYGYDVATGELVPSSPALFKVVWNSTIKPAELPLYGWDANPWVWVIEFERISREEAMK